MSDERSSRRRSTRSEDPVDKVVYGKKSIVPDCNTLAHHKGKEI